MPCNNNRGCCNRSNGSSGERICIQVKKVFDACINQFTQENHTLMVNFPSQATTFVSCKSVGNTISNVRIRPIEKSKNSRVTYDVTVMLDVEALNSAGFTVDGMSSITYQQDVLLKVPSQAITPVEVQCVANEVGVNGTINGSTCTLNLCVTLITKIVSDVDILIRDCGYPILPPCQPFSENVCAGIFDLPVYPK